MKTYLKLFKNKLTSAIIWLLYGRIFRNLGPGAIAIDCGANVGDITQMMARTGASVHAFEPNPHAFAVLKQRFEDNPQVYCHNKGVWNKEDTLRLFLHRKAGEGQVEYSVSSSLLSFKGNVDAAQSVEVGLIDLAAFIRSLGQPVALLKIDIEGAECEVLEQLLAEDLHKVIRLTVVETHDHKIHELKPRTDALRQQIRERGIRNIRMNWF